MCVCVCVCIGVCVGMCVSVYVCVCVCVQEERRRAMQEAFAMGLLDRLGGASRMHVLGVEPGVVRMVLEGV